MSKIKTIHTCSFCGYQSAKWLGKCPDCDQWNTFYEEVRLNRSPPHAADTSCVDIRPLPIASISLNEDNRIRTGIAEFDRVLGGGLVCGAVVLIGGDPGIGKSTLVLQALTSMAAHNENDSVLYVSGEESLKQVRMRAERLSCLSDNLSVLTETSVERIIHAATETKPDILAVDSVQTIYTADLESAPGSVSQIRETTSRLIKEAKEHDCALLLIGHVTKEGAIAGPRILEHMVDTVPVSYTHLTLPTN